MKCWEDVLQVNSFVLCSAGECALSHNIASSIHYFTMVSHSYSMASNTFLMLKSRVGDGAKQAFSF
jgi:hypothetical protein